MNVKRLDLQRNRAATMIKSTREAPADSPKRIEAKLSWQNITTVELMRLDTEKKINRLLDPAGIRAVSAQRTDRFLLRDLPFAVAAAFGFLVTLATFWPGYMSVDSFIQLGEARIHGFSDWHPPVMGWLWSKLDAVVPGPAAMLILHNASFWSGLGLIARNSFRSATAAVAVLAIGFLPPIFGLLSTIWKDVAQAVMLLFVFALLQHASVHRSRWALWSALLPLAYGSWVRHNGIFAALPLAFWWGKLAMKLHAGWWTRRWAITGTALFVLLVLFSRGITWALTGGRSAYVQQVILLHDLVAISLDQHENLLPAYLQNRQQPFSLERLAQIYDPGNTVHLWWGEGQRIPFIKEDTEYRQLLRQWLKVVAQNPLIYLRHRWETARSQFGLAPVVAFPFHTGVDPNHFGIRFTRGRWNTWVMMLLEATKNSFLFRGWIYVTATVALLAIGRLIRPQNFGMALVLGSSGLLYAVALFSLSAASDFRLIWWTTVAAWVLPLIVFSGAQKATEPVKGVDEVERPIVG